ncbi:MAG: nitric oxide reductase activation protein [Gammaproteobacteria bacterium]|nr:nitric oxide reductase activation protein [Gammaproteobacteria bacterium]
MSLTQALNAHEMEQALDDCIDPEFSFQYPAEEQAGQLATLSAQQQQFVLAWVKTVAKTNAELAYQFSFLAHKALGLMKPEGIEVWLLKAMDNYDKQGTMPAMATIRELEQFAVDYQERCSGLPLDEVSGILESFIHGLNGRHLQLRNGELIHTDSDTLFLPRLLSRFENREENFRLYKAIAVHLWAQTWYGTWRLDLEQELAHFKDPEHALRHYHQLETIRLDACLQRDLPGLYRDMKRLRQQLDQQNEPSLPTAVQILQQPHAKASDSLALLHTTQPAELPPHCCYQGVLHPTAIKAALEKRLAKERQEFRIALAKIVEEQEKRAIDDDSAQSNKKPNKFSSKKTPNEDIPDGFTFELELDGKPVAPPEEVQGTMESILQDLGEIPPDYLVAAGPGEYKASTALDPNDVWKGTYHEEGAFLYDEWDFGRKNYRKNWCALRELEITPQHDNFVAQTLQKHRGIAKSLHRTFEALRGEDKLLKKQPFGEDIDIDALVAAYADYQSGLEMSDRLFTRMHKEERNIAVMFMVDMSGSTQGWINEAEREALVLLCEVLETLGDRYAIYGFSGMTRKRCELYKIKTFDEPYDQTVQARISGIQPKDYTRMGVTIRHLSSLLSQVDAKIRLLITLSDGKPDDYDGYRGQYGIEDTRQALIEARRDGIHAFCITIDEEARDYLPHMYGAANYAVIDEVRKLPFKVSDIYRRLTS